MTAKPRISVVTATFNRAATLAQCLRSVQSQTYPHVEHIIQDAGSTDWSLEVIKAMMTENTKLISHTDDGIYDGINKGIARATGDIVGLLHSDDFYASDTVLEKVAELMEDPAVDGVYGDLDYVDAEDTSKIIRKWRSGDYTANRLRQGWMPPTQPFICAGACLTAGGFMTRPILSVRITTRCCAICLRARSPLLICQRSWSKCDVAARATVQSPTYCAKASKTIAAFAEMALADSELWRARISPKYRNFSSTLLLALARFNIVRRQGLKSTFQRVAPPL